MTRSISVLFFLSDSIRQNESIYSANDWQYNGKTVRPVPKRIYLYIFPCIDNIYHSHSIPESVYSSSEVWHMEQYNTGLFDDTGAHSQQKAHCVAHSVSVENLFSSR